MGILLLAHHCITPFDCEKTRCHLPLVRLCLLSPLFLLFIPGLKHRQRPTQPVSRENSQPHRSPPRFFVYPTGIPPKVDTDVGLLRGTQFGYNKCNATTEGPESNCQTAFLNSLDGVCRSRDFSVFPFTCCPDFCLWAPATPGSTVADYEGEMVAWCTKPGRGTRSYPSVCPSGCSVYQDSKLCSSGWLHRPATHQPRP